MSVRHAVRGCVRVWLIARGFKPFWLVSTRPRCHTLQKWGKDRKDVAGHPRSRRWLNTFANTRHALVRPRVGLHGVALVATKLQSTTTTTIARAFATAAAEPSPTRAFATATTEPILTRAFAAAAAVARTFAAATTAPILSRPVATAATQPAALAAVYALAAGANPVASVAEPMALVMTGPASSP